MDKRRNSGGYALGEHFGGFWYKAERSKFEFGTLCLGVDLMVGRVAETLVKPLSPGLGLIVNISTIGLTFF